MTTEITTTPDTNLYFIREKIYKLRNAIMYSMSNDLIKMPNTIVTALKIDDEGCLWFVCKAPAHYTDQYEQSFPARLHFYRKGILYYMEVSGKATIVKNEETGVEENESVLLIKMSINCVEYTEPQIRKKTKLDLIADNVQQWIMRNAAFSRHTKPVLAKLQQHNS
ncbi:MAG: hypothetical protein WDN26_22480 [Chitinophagaceae bacterium]